MSQRTYFPKKWQWAEAQVAQLRAQFNEHSARHIPSYDRRAIRSKMEGLDYLSQEISRFVRMAERFKAANV